jgi:hypothetical protein
LGNFRFLAGLGKFSYSILGGELSEWNSISVATGLHQPPPDESASINHEFPVTENNSVLTIGFV